MGWGQEFHFHIILCHYGGPQFGAETGHCPQEGLGSDREFRIENEKCPNNLEANTEWPSVPMGACGGPQVSSAGFQQEDHRARKRWGGQLCSTGRAMGRGERGHSMLCFQGGEMGGREKVGSLLLGPLLHSRIRSWRGVAEEGLRHLTVQKGRRAGRGSWHSLQEPQEPAPSGHRPHFRSAPPPRACAGWSHLPSAQEHGVGPYPGKKRSFLSSQTRKQFPPVSGRGHALQ